MHKPLSAQVIEKLKLAETTAADIDLLRDGYRPAAKRGAILFSVLAELAFVNIMYQFSLVSFLEVFGFSLRKSMPSPILPKRLKNIMDTLTLSTYNYGCTGQCCLTRGSDCVVQIKVKPWLHVREAIHQAGIQ